MDQVDELMALIIAHKEMGVTGASVIFDFIKRRIQQLQNRLHPAFDDVGTEDPCRMYAEELDDGEALIRTQQVLLDVSGVPYVPTLFSAKDPSPAVST